MSSIVSAYISAYLKNSFFINTKEHLHFFTISSLFFFLSFFLPFFFFSSFLFLLFLSNLRGVRLYNFNFFPLTLISFRLRSSLSPYLFFPSQSTTKAKLNRIGRETRVVFIMMFNPLPFFFSPSISKISNETND